MKCPSNRKAMMDRSPAQDLALCSLCGTQHQHTAGSHSCCPCAVCTAQALSIHIWKHQTQTLSKHSCTAVGPADSPLKAKHPGLAQEVIQAECIPWAAPHPHHHHYKSPHFPSPSINSLQNSTGSWITAYSALRFDPNTNNVLQKVGLSIWDLHYCSCMTMELTTESHWGKQDSHHRKL